MCEGWREIPCLPMSTTSTDSSRGVCERFRGRGTTTIAGCFVLATLGSSTVAGAQAVSSFRDLRVSLKGGERLEMTETSGVTTEGRFVALSDQSLRVSAESARLIDFPEA